MTAAPGPGPAAPGPGPATDDDPATVGTDPGLVLPTRIAYWARHDPDRRFLLEVGGRSVTYGAFHTAMLRWCTFLADLGIRAGDRVGSFLPPSIDAHLLWLAASCLGAYEVPINPDLRGPLLDHVITDAGITLCVARPGQETPAAVTDVPTDDVTPATLDRYPGPGDVACVIYTSGTTGPAKGVIVPWGQVTSTIGRIPRSWLSAADVAYAPWPMFHVTGRSPLVSMADVGGSVVLREKLSISEFWPDVRAHGCTTTTVGAVAPLLLDAPAGPDDHGHPLRTVFMAARGPLSLRFQERFGVTVVGVYGSTEIGFPIVNRSMNPATAHVAGWLRPGYRGRVVDERGTVLPDGEPGELHVKPPVPELMTLGYLGRPDLTATAIVDGWYRTGDAMIRHADGSFEFVARVTGTIRRLGENISPLAVEAVVTEDPEVAECAVLAVASDVTGQEVLLVVVPRDGVTLEPAALYARLGHVLPRHALPGLIAVRTSLPKTPTGKVRTDALEIDTDVWSRT